MRDAGIQSFAFFIFGYPGETLATMDQTVDYAIELDPDFANFYPAVPYPGTALYDKVVRDGLLPPAPTTTGRGWSTRTTCCEGNGLDERVVMDAINRAKRRFFLRPGYMARHVGDVARLAAIEAGDRLAGAVADDVRREGRQTPRVASRSVDRAQRL